MKLRCTTNSIRLRLVKSDLDRLLTQGSVTEKIYLGNKREFSFGIVVQDTDPHVNFSYENSSLHVSLPKKLSLEWANSDQVGIERFIELDSQEQLHILIEKDFPCKDLVEEDKENTFWELAEKDGNAC